MKRVAASALMVVFVNSYALGGTVSFAPATRTIDPSAGDPTTVTFDVSVTASDSLGTFTSVDVIMGSNDGLSLTDFTLDPTFTAAFVFNSVNIPASPAVYASDIKAGGFGIAAQAPPVLIGTLTVDAAGLPNGDYQILVNSDMDGNRSKLGRGIDIEPLFGGLNPTDGVAGMVSVVPEPATISLLALGALGLIRRRKSL